MLLRMQRRRISARTRRRCHAIRGFFRKALDTYATTSQFFTKYGSNLFNNQTNKKAMDENVQQNKLNKKGSESNMTASKTTIGEPQNILETIEKDKKTREVKTEVLFETPENRNKRLSSKPSLNNSDTGVPGAQLQYNSSSATKIKKKRNHYQKYIPDEQFYRSNSAFKAQDYSTYYEENKFYIKKHQTRKHCSEHRQRGSIISEDGDNRKKFAKEHKKRTKRYKLHKQTSEYGDRPEKKYITDIIQSPYEPFKTVEKLVSEASQFSMPVCRDHISPENTCTEQTEVLNNANSSGNVCDDQKSRTKRYRERNPPKLIYNNSDSYDLIPVKEKSTPKSRRKFAEDQMFMSCLHKEVPPSPRTNRPRLNLIAKKYTDYDDYQNMHLDQNEILNEYTDETIIKSMYVENENANVKRTSKTYINQSHDPKSLQKPDETLNEIKETLQRFLQEVKRDTSYNRLPEQHEGCFGASHAVLPLLNSCYYPILPICPLNYMQSGYVPSSSNCAACTHSNESEGTVAEQLIKQIHQGASPIMYEDKSYRNQVFKTTNHSSNRPMTSRSAGSGRVFNYCDIDVQIPALKCTSNSTATIGSKGLSKEGEVISKASYSDSNLDRFNLSQSIIEDMRCLQDPILQAKPTSFKKLLQRFGTLKKFTNFKASKQLHKEGSKDTEECLPLGVQRRKLQSILTHDDPEICISDKNTSSNQLKLNDPLFLKNFYLKEVQVKSAGTQVYQKKRCFIGILTKRQPDRILYASKPYKENSKWLRWIKHKEQDFLC